MSHLTRTPLDPSAALLAISRPEHGGTAMFLGTTRAETQLREVTAIEYAAHDDLAEAEIGRVLDEARDRFGVEAFARHRLGVVALSEQSVIVAASAPHRAEAFEACRFLIDEIKRRAPIWKRMHYADGDTEWIDGTAHQNDGRPVSAG